MAKPWVPQLVIPGTSLGQASRGPGPAPLPLQQEIIRGLLCPQLAPDSPAWKLRPPAAVKTSNSNKPRQPFMIIFFDFWGLFLKRNFGSVRWKMIRRTQADCHRDDLISISFLLFLLLSFLIYFLICFAYLFAFSSPFQIENGEIFGTNITEFKYCSFLAVLFPLNKPPIPPSNKDTKHHSFSTYPLVIPPFFSN